ncbi:MAG: hypothetical protein N2645_14425 [Clostridia bacterium]|nr:hypothetical protein [Clostridia bacterium]
MRNSLLKKINKKNSLSASENIASQNAPIVVGGYAIYVLYSFLVAIGLLMIVGEIIKLGCRCSCRCYTDWRTMAAAQGYGNNAITLAR